MLNEGKAAAPPRTAASLPFFDREPMQHLINMHTPSNEMKAVLT